jgi:hypothetical protein
MNVLIADDSKDVRSRIEKIISKKIGVNKVYQAKNLFMSYFKYLMLLICILAFTNINSQEFDKTSRKVQIYTHQERDNLHMWLHNELTEMKFTEEELYEYYAVIFYYISKMSRLDDLDKGYTQKEFKKELNKILALEDKEIREMLSEERYKIHRRLHNELMRSAYKRWGISN